jgi:DNA replication protein DnaC
MNEHEHFYRRVLKNLKQWSEVGDMDLLWQKSAVRSRQCHQRNVQRFRRDNIFNEQTTFDDSSFDFTKSAIKPQVFLKTKQRFANQKGVKK